MSTSPLTLVWFTNNLRLADNPALCWAASRGPVAAVYIDDPAADLGGAARWWLDQALRSLAEALKAHHVPLILQRGDPAQLVPQLAKEIGATSVSWSRRYEPNLMTGDRAVETALAATGIEAAPHAGYLLFDPASIATKTGTPYKVYGPFSRACLSAPAPDQPVPPPSQLDGVTVPAADTLDGWRLVPAKATWPTALAEAWDVDEDTAATLLHDFLADALPAYPRARDLPAVAGSSRLSPYLHWGLISPRQTWHAALRARAKAAQNHAGVERFLLELLWREFNWHMLQAVPDLPTRPLDTRFAAFPWRDDPTGLTAWQRGQTGYPVVDAGMRQLWQTGWMHNRVRMITASFLIKHLLIDWQTGMNWFWDTLVDADLGSNTGNWQWVAGCGADASPFFRIFNPMIQGKKFDPDGGYVRTFVPELAALPSRYIHEPWTAPADILDKAGVELGRTYPRPIVDHDAARARALAALKAVTGRNGD